MRVLIVGAGLGGLCLAQKLRQAGMEVRLFERNAATADDLAGYGIHLDRHGWRALIDCLPPRVMMRLDDAAGHAGAVLHFHDERLRPLATRDDADLLGKSVAEVQRRSIGRVRLREILLAGLDGAEGVRPVVEWDREFVDYDEASGNVRARFSDGSEAEGDVLIGADASNSRVRRRLLPNLDRVDLGILNVAGRYPLNAENSARLPAIFTDGSLNNIVPPHSDWMFVSAWRVDGEDYVVWAYVARRESYPAGAEKMDGIALRDHVLSRIDTWASPLKTLVAGSDLTTVAPVPLRSMPYLETWKPGAVTLLGDAIHNMTPMAGIGANTALRDAALLGRRLVEAAQGERALVDAVGAYEAEMRGYANAAVALSRRNAERAVSPARLPRIAFRTALRAAEAFPAVKRRMFG
jgi:2-polyprenyl-6-methoxyphenol hydroxylase-like FAD-dependent oxidoreductase